MSELTIGRLEERARELRQLVIRQVAAAGSGHVAGPLGFADVMAVLYFQMLRLRPEEPDWSDRDLFVMSNGHYAPLLYAAMAMRGFLSESELMSLRQLGSRLQGHPERVKLPGLETTSGPLGCGLSQAAGMAYYLQHLQSSDRLVYCSLGDGELNEGNIWEAAMFAAKYKLGRLIAIIDRNTIQIGGSTEQVMPLDDLGEKWRSFGWQVQEIDGHDMARIIAAIEAAQAVREQPSIIIAHTIPGRGVDFMEGDYRWHGKAPNAEQAAAALAQLGLLAKKQPEEGMGV
ncbi:transketolase [Candidatus Saccharibacteria bacterium oral taxon 488]|jgi:transketolase domain protein|nr:transketolase [Candidatus Saccharibacteria bacterium oral taxon 488]